MSKSFKFIRLALVSGSLTAAAIASAQPASADIFGGIGRGVGGVIGGVGRGVGGVLGGVGQAASGIGRGVGGVVRPYPMSPVSRPSYGGWSPRPYGAPQGGVTVSNTRPSYGGWSPRPVIRDHRR
jgi:hypothetical protein